MPINTSSIITTELETIDPARAGRYLATSKLNRSLSRDTILAYAITMKRSEWYNWPPIEFDEDDNLINGHHRLNAAIAAGITLQIYVVRGVNPQNQLVMDVGVRKRSLTQQMKMYRETLDNRAYRASYVTMCAYLLTGVRVKIETLRDYDLWNSLFKNGVDWAIDFATPDKMMRGSSVGGALAFAYATNPEKVLEFGNNLKHGENLSEGDPALALRRALLNTPPGMRTGTYRLLVARRVLNCLRSHLHGEKIQKTSSVDAGRAFFLEQYEGSRRAKQLSLPWQTKSEFHIPVIESSTSEDQPRARA